MEELEKHTVSGIMLTVLLLSLLTFSLNIQLVRAQPRTWTVDDDGPADFQTIQEAINAASPGDRVFVYAGTYYEHVVVDKSISLLGENRTSTVIDGEGVGSVLSVRRENGAENVTIAGFTIQNSGTSTLNYPYFDAGIMIHSDYNNISGNNLGNNQYGVFVLDSEQNNVQSNNITNNNGGIYVFGFNLAASHNIAENNITDNQLFGVSLWKSYGSGIFGNNITNNGNGIELTASSLFNNVSENNIANNQYGIRFYDYRTDESHNKFYHNNFIDNGVAPSAYYSPHLWDDGYPSGGNYWSDFSGADVYWGPYQNLTGSDGIGDTSYIVDQNNEDRYPLMDLWPSGPGLHELEATLKAPSSLPRGSSTSIEATVKNQGINDEEDVTVSLSINSTLVNSEIISLLEAGSSYSINYLWAPAVDGTYNVTAYAHPVHKEILRQNNQMTKFVTVAVPTPPPEVKVGVKTGDWIKCTYTISGWPAGTPYPEWLKVEFLSVEGTAASVRVTMRMSNGTELTETVPVDIVSGGQAFGLSGFVIPANSKVGDTINFGGFGFTSTATIEGEDTRTYSGASRTVVYASFSQYGIQLTYYWDKQTGVMVEGSLTSGSVTAIGRATETNMWEAVSSPFWMQWWFYAIVAVVIVALGGAAYFLRKRKPPTPNATPLPTEGT